MNPYLERFQYTAGPEDRGKTLEDLLRQAGFSGRHLRRLARRNRIRVNGKRSFLAKPLKPGDRIDIDLREVPAGAATPVPENDPRAPAGTVSVLFEDPWLLIVDKPPGVPAHTGRGARNPSPDATLEGRLRRMGANSRPPWIPHLVHRLDRDTGGVLLVAKSSAVHAALDRQLRSGGIRRMYGALVEGDASELPDRIDLPIAPDPLRPGRYRAASSGVSGARPAVTRILSRRVSFRPDRSGFEGQTSSAVSFLELSLETGRTHQIRVHLSALGHPVLGDPWYGNARPGTGLFLHARRIALVHPVGGNEVLVTSPWPESWKKWIPDALLAP
ncbi:MAG: RluA family pseudouridine synthase [Alicyclobacillaceae bacterium]|nr:RluA family pseudouridine synthase [Alicyclobacillaceae bacterium]